MGFEPTTYGLRNRCSATELHRPTLLPHLHGPCLAKTAKTSNEEASQRIYYIRQRTNLSRTKKALITFLGDTVAVKRYPQTHFYPFLCGRRPCGFFLKFNRSRGENRACCCLASQLVNSLRYLSVVFTSVCPINRDSLYRPPPVQETSERTYGGTYGPTPAPPQYPPAP